MDLTTQLPARLGERQPGTPQRGPSSQMTLGVEGVVDGGVSGQKPLRRHLRLETQHLSLALPDRQMRVLDAVVLPQPAGSVEPYDAQLFGCRDI